MSGTLKQLLPERETIVNIGNTFDIFAKHDVLFVAYTPDVVLSPAVTSETTLVDNSSVSPRPIYRIKSIEISNNEAVLNTYILVDKKSSVLSGTDRPIALFLVPPTTTFGRDPPVSDYQIESGHLAVYVDQWAAGSSIRITLEMIN